VALDILLINTIIGGTLGTIGGAFGIYMTARNLKKSRAEDRAKFLKAQQEQIHSEIVSATQEVKQELNRKFDNVESVLKSRGEILDEIRTDVSNLERNVDSIEKKLIALDKAAELKLPEIDKIRSDIESLKDKIYQLQLGK
jgi:chromosome segregation ATPase